MPTSRSPGVPTVEPLSAAEKTILTMLLEGDEPVLNVLRKQMDSMVVEGRRLSGVGFFAELKATCAVQPITKGRVVIGGVQAQVRGMKHGAGFHLFTKDGVLSTLEGVSLSGEPWPVGEPEILRLGYSSSRDRQFPRFDKPARPAALDPEKVVQVHVQLLTEESPTYRPTPAEVVAPQVVRLLPPPKYDILDETWAFLPGALVRVASGTVKGREVLMAIAPIAPDAEPTHRTMETAMEPKIERPKPGTIDEMRAFINATQDLIDELAVKGGTLVLTAEDLRTPGVLATYEIVFRKLDTGAWQAWGVRSGVDDAPRPLDLDVSWEEPIAASVGGAGSGRAVARADIIDKGFRCAIRSAEPEAKPSPSAPPTSPTPKP